MNAVLLDNPLSKVTEIPPAFPYLDLQAQFFTIREEVLDAITHVMESQHFIMGKEVEAFEKEISHYCETPNAVSCASGSDALLLALLGLGIGPGDEVLTTPFTFVALIWIRPCWRPPSPRAPAPSSPCICSGSRAT